jgi:hypothetical protein
MEGLQQTRDVTELFYEGQFVEIDCLKLYAKLGISLALESVAKANTEATQPAAREEEGGLPSFITGRISSLTSQDFWMRLREIPPGLEERLAPEMKISCALLDPNGMFKFDSRIQEVKRAEHSLRALRVERAIACRYRRYIRVAVRGRAFFLSEEFQEGGEEASLVDLGGAGVRVETSVSWLRIGDQLTILIETGFLDEADEKHLSLDIKVPARVVWLRQMGGTETAPVYHVGFAFTEISMQDQDRLIGFILAYAKSKLK